MLWCWCRWWDVVDNDIDVVDVVYVWDDKDVVDDVDDIYVDNIDVVDDVDVYDDINVVDDVDVDNDIDVVDVGWWCSWYICCWCR